MKKKKDRGLKRRTRSLKYWSDKARELDLNKLTISEVIFAKVPKDLINSLMTKGEVSGVNWVNKSIFQSLFDIYFQWNRGLKSNYDEYYLKLWIYYPNIEDSMIVAAVGEKINYYNTVLDRDLEISEFPQYLQDVKELSQKFNFRWSAYKDEIVIYESDYKDTPEKLEELKKMVYRVKEETEIGRNDRYYYIKKGTIWVGSAIFNSNTPNVYIF